MIIGIILRNYKTYKGINYIPISNGEKFCGLIGSNGIGKSSVLEAIDCYFNNRVWNQNIDSNKSGVDTSFILPIFLIDKSKITKNVDIAEKLSNAIWNIETDTTIHPIYKENIEKLKQTTSQFDTRYTSKTHYILPLGENNDRKFTLSVFRIPSVHSAIGIKEQQESVEQRNEETEEQKEDTRLNFDEFELLKTEVKELYDYIYIPKDIDPHTMVQLETRELQTLLGENLETIISKSISKEQINEISKSLKAFIEELSNKLDGYKFKAPSNNQPNLKPVKIYSLIVEEFFNLRELHKNGNDGKDLNLKQLSSGEKQQAILSVFHSIINSYRKNSSNLILAVDEPEASLHISACFDQFEKLYEISNSCGQIIFSSHWYGFIPAMNNGIIINISRANTTHKFLMFDIAKYREQIKQDTITHNKNKIELPLDIMLKSNNDFIQSIISSLIRNDPYNWLICEGSSERIYFEEYFKSEINTKKLRIIPVGGASEIKKIYNHLQISFEELKDKIKGKVILISDTDRQLVEYETSDNNNLFCRRIVYDPNLKQTILVRIKSNPKSPNTEIEDALNGIAFHKSLLYFKSDYPNELSFLSENINKTDAPSGIALNLRPTDSDLLDTFFNIGNNKCLFARRYVEILKQDEYQIPSWIQEIKDFLI